MSITNDYLRMRLHRLSHAQLIDIITGLEDREAYVEYCLARCERVIE